MPASIGVNLRVTGNCRQGGRKYMEDFFSVAYQQTEDEKDLEYAFFGIFDGHGGSEAASFAKEHLMETIIKQKNFWSDDDEDVLRAIKDGYIATHYAMWREQWKWPKTSSGLPSTAGTTASIAFIRRGKIYMGHVGDSGIILGYQVPGTTEWKAKSLTKDHKPECEEEMNRITNSGGKVVAKAGVPRVVWNRPKAGHVGPVRRSTPIDEIPFLAVARSLGDLWSYNSQLDQFIVSPSPDCSVLPIDANIHRCLIFGTDGLLNMLSPNAIVHIVQQAERRNESAALGDGSNKVWLNPSKLLVSKALEKWLTTKMRADNTSVVTLMLDPPGPPRAQVLKDRKKNLPETGLKILTRYDETASQETDRNSESTSSNENDIETVATNAKPLEDAEDRTSTLEESILETSDLDGTKSVTEEEEEDGKCKEPEPVNEHQKTEPQTPLKSLSSLALEILEKTTIVPDECNISTNSPSKNDEKEFIPKLNESTNFEPKSPSDVDVNMMEILNENNQEDETNELDDTIQIHEISSSTISEDHRLTPFDINIKGIHLTSEVPLKDQTVEVQNIELQSDKITIVKKKRKSHHVGDVAQRKSLRISLNQKSPDVKQTPAPCTLAEEKLKKLAEEAESLKKVDNENIPMDTNNLNYNLISSVTTIAKDNVPKKSIRAKRNGNVNKPILKKNPIIDTQKLKVILHNIFPNLGNKSNKNLDNVKVIDPQIVATKKSKESTEIVEKAEIKANLINNKKIKDSISETDANQAKKTTKPSGKIVSSKIKSKRLPVVALRKENLLKKKKNNPIEETSNKEQLETNLIDDMPLTEKDPAAIVTNIPKKRGRKKGAKIQKKIYLPVKRNTRSAMPESGEVAVIDNETAVGSFDNKKMNTKENITPKSNKTGSSNKKIKTQAEEAPPSKESTTKLQEKIKTKSKPLIKSKKNK